MRSAESKARQAAAIEAAKLLAQETEKKEKALEAAQIAFK